MLFRCTVLGFFLVGLFALTQPLRAEVGTVQFDAQPLLNQARVYLDEGRLLECIDAWHQVYQYSHKPEEQALGLVRVADVLALFLNQKEEALALYHQARSEYAPSTVLENAFFNAGMIEYELNRSEAARTSFEQFVTLFPDSYRQTTAQYMVQRLVDEIAAAAPPPPPPKLPIPEVVPKPVPEVVPKPAPEPPPLAVPVPEPEPPLVPEETEPQVRVALEQAATVTLRFGAAVNVRTAGGVQRWPAGEYRFALAGGQLQSGSNALGREAMLEPVADRFYWQGNPYHGRAQLKIVRNQVLLVNHLPLETYLEGVVPKEMPASWELEALKAQAVSARSYAYYILRKSEDKDYDVAATTASQVYGGADQGNAATRKAIAETGGHILMYDQQPVLTYFHSHSGGVLEDANLVWSGSSLPYYQVRNDDVSQQFRSMTWETHISDAAVASALQRNGFKIKQVLDLQAAETSDSGRLVSVRAVTDSGDITVRANSLRIWLGAADVKSVLTAIEKTSGGYHFKGRGYGHGVGMSQWGAQGMARQGSRYEQILAHYYPGTQLQMIYAP